MPAGSKAFMGFTIRFPSNTKAKFNLLRFGWFSDPGSHPVTVTRGVGSGQHIWTIEAVEPDPTNPGNTILSLAFLLEGQEKPKGSLFKITGEGPLPFHITIECKDDLQCVAPLE